MASNHLVLCHPLLLLPSIFPSIRVFSNDSVLHIKWPKYWSFNNFFKLLKRKFNREILNLVYALKFSLAKFSCSIVSDSLQCHGPQHARLPCLSITSSRSLLKLMCIESVMPPNHLILCRPLLLLPSIFPSIRVFSNTQLLTSGGLSIGVSASTSVLPINTQD